MRTKVEVIENFLPGFDLSISPAFEELPQRYSLEHRKLSVWFLGWQTMDDKKKLKAELDPYPNRHWDYGVGDMCMLYIGYEFVNACISTGFNPKKEYIANWFADYIIANVK